MALTRIKILPCLCMICTGGVSAVRISDRPKVEPVCSNLLGHFPSKSKSHGGVYKPIGAALASTSPYHTRYGLWLEYGQRGGLH